MKVSLGFIFLFCIVLVSSQVQIEKYDKLIEKAEKLYSKNIDSSNYYIRKVLAESLKEKNEFYTARCLACLGSVYFYKSDYDNALIFANKALPFASKTKNYKALCRIYNVTGIVNYERGEYNKALDCYEKALGFLEHTKEPKYYTILYSNLGNLFLSKSDTLSAVYYYKLKEKHALINKDTSRLQSAYNNLATIELKRNNDLAKIYLNKGADLAKKTGNKRDLFEIRFNQSSAFASSVDRVENEHLLPYLKDAERLANEIGDQSLYFYIYFNYGGYYLNKKDYKNAIKFYTLAYKTFDYNKIPLEQKLDILKKITTAYEESGNYQKSYEYQTKFYKLKDSLFSLEKEKNYNELFTKFEVEKKNSQISLLNKQNELEKERKTKLYFIIALVSLMLLLSFLFYRNRLKTQKKLGKKQEELNLTKGILEGQNEERNRLAKELHDGVAGSLVGINLMLNHENETLKNTTLSKIHEHLNKTYEEIREISHNLSSNFLQEKSFQNLVNLLAMQYEEKDAFNTEVSIFPENAFSTINENLKRDLYRILQELFANIHKHAKAKEVQISLTQNKNEATIMIEDDGIGFAENSKEGIGLKNIRERLKPYQANLQIDSQTNRGTCIIININL